MEEESDSSEKEDIFFDFVPSSFTSSTPSTNSKGDNLNKKNLFSMENSDYHNDDSVKMPKYDLRAQSRSSSSTDEPESNEGVSYEFRNPLKYNIMLDDLNFGVNQSFQSASDNSTTEIKDASSDKYDTAYILTDNNASCGPKNVTEVSRVISIKNEDLDAKCEVKKEDSKHLNQISSCDFSETSDELFNTTYTTSESENYVSSRSVSLSTNINGNLQNNFIAGSVDPFLPAINRSIDGTMIQTNTTCNYYKYFSEAAGLDTEGNSEAFGSAFTEKLSFAQREKPELFRTDSTEYIAKNQPIIVKVANASKAASTVTSEVENSDGTNNTPFKTLNVLYQEISNDKCISDFCEENMQVDFETEKEVSNIRPMQLGDSFSPDYEIMTDQDEEIEGEIVETGVEISKSKPMQLDDSNIPDYDILADQDKETGGIVETDNVSNIKIIELDDGCTPVNDRMTGHYKGTDEEILEINEEVLKMSPIQLYDCYIPDNIMTDQDIKIEEEMEIDEVPKMKAMQLYDDFIPDNDIVTDQNKLETEEGKLEADEGTSIDLLFHKDKNTKSYLKNESTEENLKAETISHFSHEHESERMKEMGPSEEMFDNSNSANCKKHPLELREQNEKNTELEREIDIGNHSEVEDPSECLQINKVKPFKGVEILLNLFEVDNVLSKTIISAMSSNKFIKSGITQTEMLQCLREENYAETLAKSKLGIAMFFNAAMNAGIIYTKNRRYLLNFESHTENSSGNQTNNATKRKSGGTIQGNAENLENGSAKRRKVIHDVQSKPRAGNELAGPSHVKTMHKASGNKGMKNGISKEVVLQKTKVNAKTEYLDKKKPTLRSSYTDAQNRKPKEKSSPKRKVATVDKSQTRMGNGKNKKEAKEGDRLVTSKSSVKNDVKRNIAKAADAKYCKKQKSAMKTIQITSAKPKEIQGLSLHKMKLRGVPKVK